MDQIESAKFRSRDGTVVCQIITLIFRTRAEERLLAGKYFGGYYPFMAIAEARTHIIFDEKGVARIDQTTIKVVEIALDHLAYGWSADAIHEQYPHLSMAQIHAALAYFYDHQPEIEKQISEIEEYVTKLRAELGSSPSALRLRQIKAARQAAK
jgi:uncharacterized protein (DUF433 family)